MNVAAVTYAKTHLAVIVRDSDIEDVVLLKHGNPAAVVMSAGRHEALLDTLEDISDRPAVHERDHMTRDFDTLLPELGLSN